MLSNESFVRVVLVLFSFAICFYKYFKYRSTAFLIQFFGLVMSICFISIIRGMYKYILMIFSNPSPCVEQMPQPFYLSLETLLFLHVFVHIIGTFFAHKFDNHSQLPILDVRNLHNYLYRNMLPLIYVVTILIFGGFFILIQVYVRLTV